MSNLLNEDGRCRFTELLPGECGCDKHRGGKTPEEETRVPYWWRAGDLFKTKWPGYCFAGEHWFEGGVFAFYYFPEMNYASETKLCCERHMDK